MFRNRMMGLLMLLTLACCPAAAAEPAAAARTGTRPGADACGNAEMATLRRLYQVIGDPDSGGNPVALRRQAQTLLESCNDDQLRALADAQPGVPLSLDAALQLAWRSYAAGRPTEAQRHLQPAPQAPTPAPAAAGMPAKPPRRLQPAAPVPSYRSRVIGVLLPLSGRFAPFGAQVRRGMELAVADHNLSRSPVTLLWRDTNGDSAVTERLIAELAANPDVEAVIGPLTAATAGVAADAAQQAGLPLLALSQRDHLAETGSWIFRSSLTSRQQGETLARFALQQGIRRFAILTPQNRLGQDLSEAFAAAVQRGGGELIGQQQYPSGTTDFGPHIRQLLGVAQLPPAGRTPVEERPVIPFQALFIPDHADQIVQLAPQLAYYGLKDILLLGSTGWHAPELPVRAGISVQGAVVASGFFPDSADPAVAAFVNLYRQRHGQTPTLLEAQGYDAAGLLLSTLETLPPGDRAALRQALSQMEGHTGATGTTRFDAEGDALRDLFLLQIRDGRFVQINE